MKREEFNITVLPLQDKLFRFAVSILKNINNAEDALQEVLIKLWERKDDLSKYNSVEAFAMRMMKNHCIDRLRRVNNNIDINDNLLDKNEVTPERQTVLKDTINLAYRLIEQLPPTQQMIMRLRDVEEYDLNEIAEIMEMNPNAVRTNLSRARQTVREQLLKIELFGIQMKA
ncbi:MAG: sigma-70 family RNA polymerase sigma factor [Prevotellaceae bacterium]|jgi:RNA polymerase sigma-70 factor (ECF subfamily)|nr:sigma-70 family RNA polymerase sigma factor [Prevotellaceae bacterium]